uniref:Chitinase n=1 Tax=Camellia fraterna TaxID=542725 RepID=A0A2I6RLF9_9ERIC|nr:chitinase [Camellia fraterna]
MRSWALTMAFLLATLLITKGSAEQCGSQVGGALCPGGLCSTTPPPPAAPSPLGDGDITDLITSSMFDIMLPNRNYSGCDSEDFYTYDAFITAAKSFPTFATTGDTDTRKRELAAFFGQTSHQTTGNPPGGPYLWGYCYVKQINPSDNCDQASEAQWPCAPGKQYYGRGPMQLSYNYNYGPAGVALGLGMELLKNPDLVETDPVISFKTALWFWMTPQAPKPSCHDVITGNWIPSPDDLSVGRLPGYGVITNIINGGIECGHGQDPKVEDRIGFYKRYCSDEIFDVRTGDNLDCNNQAPFGTVLFLDSM